MNLHIKALKKEQIDVQVDIGYLADQLKFAIMDSYGLPSRAYADNGKIVQFDFGTSTLQIIYDSPTRDQLEALECCRLLINVADRIMKER